MEYVPSFCFSSRTYCKISCSKCPSKDTDKESRSDLRLIVGSTDLAAGIEDVAYLAKICLESTAFFGADPFLLVLWPFLLNINVQQLHFPTSFCIHKIFFTFLVMPFVSDLYHICLILLPKVGNNQSSIDRACWIKMMNIIRNAQKLLIFKIVEHDR